MYGKIFKRESYNVGIIYAPIHSVLSSECQPEIQWLPRRSRSGTFVADPFGIEHNGRQYLLCEYFDYREPKARIMGAEINCPLFSADLKDAIVAPCHISYPFLFRHEGQVYCIPETSRANEVALYKAEKLPYTWTKEMVLLNDISAVDPSIVHFSGRWWLFYSDRNFGSTNLCISYADSLYGPWFPHSTQPAKKDISSSRPGGTPFIHKGKLYRPAQDCSKAYGGRVVINEVVVLSADYFEEKTVAAVEPNPNGPYPDGLHTLSAVGNMILVDGRCEQFILSAVIRSARTFLKRTFKTIAPEDL